MPYSYGCLALKYWCAESENKGQRKHLLHILQRPSEDYPDFAGDNATDTLCWRCLIRVVLWSQRQLRYRRPVQRRLSVDG